MADATTTEHLEREPGSGNACLLEAVPNFSEAADVETLVDLRAAMRRAGAIVADVHADIDHSRSVFTVFGTPETLREALLAAAEVAVERIDLRSHAGAHPRVGALDVLPIIALEGLPIAPGGRADDGPAFRGGGVAAARALASNLATEIAARHALPVLGYAGSAPVDGGDASFAGALRRGGVAGLAERLASGEVVPIAGPATLHPSAGATICGERPVLVAFNVLLDCADIRLAATIARSIRGASLGGLPGVRAIGVEVPDRDGRVQVSTNVERWAEASPGSVLHRVVDLAAQSGVTVHSCELVGLAPSAAVDELAASGIDLVACEQPRLELHAAAAARSLGLG